MAEAAAPVQLGLTLSPLDGTLQPFTEEALEVGRGKKQQQQDGGGGGTCVGVNGVRRVGVRTEVFQGHQRWRRENETRDGGGGDKVRRRRKTLIHAWTSRPAASASQTSTSSGCELRLVLPE